MLELTRFKAYTPWGKLLGDAYIKSRCDELLSKLDVDYTSLTWHYACDNCGLPFSDYDDKVYLVADVHKLLNIEES